VNDVTWFNLWTYTIESETIRNVWLCPFGSLAKNPLANIGWAVNQYDAPVFALTQESNNLNVHKSDLIQVHEYADVLIVHLSLYVADIGRLNSTTELQGSGVSVRLLFNPQHWQLPLYQLGIGCWIRKSAFPRYSGVHDECHLQAIEEKRATSILSGVFSTNGENSTNCLNRRTWDRLLMPACGRNARRAGNFCESERQHVMRGMRAEV
jgi:hypothetical protein